MSATTDGIRENVAAARFEMPTDAGLAFISYRQAGGVVSLDHAEVPARLRGSGVAPRLVLGVFEMLRATGRSMIPRCGYVQAIARKHPEYSDILAP